MKIKQVKNHWALIIALVFLFALLGIQTAQIVHKNNGKMTYCLDDAYIHMAIAKNIAQHGVWGITRDHFSSADSSLLWVLLLSVAFRIFGVHEFFPLIFNIVFAVACVCFFNSILIKYATNSFFIFFALTTFIYTTPLPANVFNGMEHILQILINIAFIYFSIDFLCPIMSESNNDETAGRLKWLLLATPLVTMVRFEGLFVLLAVVLLFFLKKRFFHAVLLGIAGLLPIMIYGVISLVKGAYFFPNSVVMKSEMPHLLSVDMIRLFLKNISTNALQQHLFFPFLASILILILASLKIKQGFYKRDGAILSVYILIALMHLVLAKTGYWFRYEAYLVALAVFANALVFNIFLSKMPKINARDKILYLSLSIFIFLLFVAAPSLKRGWRALRDTSQAANNIYAQQYQMGTFLRTYYQGQGVAANDVGAINFLADIHCLDLWGLADIRIAKAYRYGYFNTNYINHLLNDKKIVLAIIYEKPFKEFIKNWQKVCDWTISDNVVCASATVSFFAIDRKEKNNLKRNLENYQGHLPKSVSVIIYK